MKRVIGMVALVSVCLSSLPAAAAETSDAKASAESVASAAPSTSVIVDLRREVKRPSILPALYVTFGTVQAWDLYTTTAALKNGAHEANPVAARFAGNTAQMIALKAATSAATIFFTERAWRKNRVSAVVVMAAINGGIAAVAMHNAGNARAGR